MEDLELNYNELKSSTPEELIDLKFELEDMSEQLKELIENNEE